MSGLVGPNTNSKQLPNYVESFRDPLQHTFQGTISEMMHLPGYEHLLVRVEPFDENNDYVAYNQALSEFEHISGIAVVHHYEAVGMAPYSDGNELPYEVSESGSYKAMFHVTEKVVGRNVSVHTEATHAIPPDQAAKLLEGIFTYFVYTAENQLPHIYEVRPEQFMYGTTISNPEPQLYFVDIDYALGQDAEIGDLLGWIDHCATYLREYGADSALQPVAQKMLDFLISHPEARTHYSDFAYKIEWDLKDYLDDIDRKSWGTI